MFFGFEVEEAQRTEDEKAPAEQSDCQSALQVHENPTTSAIASAASLEWNSWTSGFTGFLQTVKQTTATVADTVKQDISEIAKGLLEEESPKTAEERAKQSAFENALDSLDDGLEKAEHMALAGLSNFGAGLLNVGSSLFATSTSKASSANQQTLSDRFAHQVLEAAIDRKTYLEPFSANDFAAKERYQLFESSFDQIAHAGKIALLIDQQPGVHSLMKKLVPKELTEEIFWTRYFFKVSQLELDQNTRSLIVASNEPLITEDQEVAWSDSSEDENLTQRQKEEESSIQTALENPGVPSPLSVDVENDPTETHASPAKVPESSNPLPPDIHTSESNSSFDIVEMPAKVAETSVPITKEEWEGWD